MILASISSTRRAIVLQLKSCGPMSITNLATALQTTSSAVRQAIAPLAEEGFLAAEKQEEDTPRRGRKRYIYRLTGKGRAQLFPTLQADIVSGLVQHLQKHQPHVLVEFINEYLDEFGALTTERFKGAPVEDRFAIHVEYYDRSGFFPESTIEDDGTQRLKLRNCPSRVLGDQCEQICAAEQQIIAEAFAPEYRTERTAWQLDGDTDCVYEFTPVAH